MLSAPKKILIPLFVISLVIVLGAVYLMRPQASKKEKFLNQIKSCNHESSNLRFSCYQFAIDKYYENDIPGLTEVVKNKELDFEEKIDSSKSLSYAVFGTNCHSFYHALGDFVATNVDGDLRDKINMFDASCTGGYMMGLYKRTALINNFSDEILARLFQVCPVDIRHQCAHEVGHLLHDKYTTSILGVIDKISAEKYGFAAARDYTYTTRKEVDLNAPFVDCTKLVPEEELAYCYTGIGHNLFLFSEFSPEGYKTAIKQCQQTEDSHTEDCYAFLIYRIGINEAGSAFMSKKYADGRKICEDSVKLMGRPDLLTHCYLGIGGGIGLFLDSNFAGFKLTKKNAQSARKLVTEQILACEEAGDYKDQCYRGILGTPTKKLYKMLELKVEPIEKILPSIDSGFQVVG